MVLKGKLDASGLYASDASKYIHNVLHISDNWDKLRCLKTKGDVDVQLKERGTLYRTAEDIQKQKCVT